jgi:farnesyl diphosphate synthase
MDAKARPGTVSDTDNHSFARRLDAISVATEAMLRSYLADTPEAGEIFRPARLLDAMRHAAGGGKRLRPFLLVESAALFGFAETKSLPAAAAFECVHCYSLVHDDLPAMDDDDLRRGQPTVHRAFDEATAILAGDSLLTLAFDILSRESAHPDPAIRGALISLLAHASGVGGMAGGQMLDLEAEGRFAPDRKPLSLAANDIERLQAMKTGALLSAACEAGAILGGADLSDRRALLAYARAFGLAFQLSDDLIDAEGSAEAVGKRVGKDAGRGKATLVGELGIPAAKQKLSALIDEAEAALAPFGAKAAMLVSAARFLAKRDH